MTTKTIALRLEAYERLRRARRRPGEPFSDVVLRARWPDEGITARELLQLYEREGPLLPADAPDAIENVARKDKAPVTSLRITIIPL